MATAPVLSKSSSSLVTAFGDSLTDGGSNGELWPESDTWPTKLDAILPAATVTNLGRSGATVDELLMRIGAMPMRFNIPTSVPVNGNTVVTPLQTYGLPNSQVSIYGTLNGNVQLLKSAANVWTLYNYSGNVISAGDTTIAPEAGWANRGGDTAVIWIGVNDITSGIKGLEDTVADHVVAGHQKLIEWLTPQVKQFLILGVTTRTVETTGGVNHTTATEINERLKALYPGNFKSVQKCLREQAMTDLGITPTQTDLDKIAAGTLPPSVLAVGDVGHISKPTATVIATHLVGPWLKAKGFVAG